MDDTVHDARFAAGYAFDEFRLDVRRARLTHRGVEVALTPKAFAVLEYLVRNAGRLVDKQSLLEEAWPNVVVEESNLSQTIYLLRRALGEQPSDHRFIVTVPGRGYRFVADVRPLDEIAAPGAPRSATVAPRGAPADAAPSPSRTATPLPGVATEPRAASTSRSAAALEAIAADGLPAGDTRPLGAAAGARTPAVSRRRLVAGIAAGLVLAAGAAGIAAWRRKASGDADVALAQRLIVKAREAALGTQREASAQAIAYLRRATELDPSSAEAWGELALAYQSRMEMGADRELPPLAEWTRAAATRALAIDPDRASAKIALATVLPNFRRWAAQERALRQLYGSIPSHPALETALGWVLCDVGRWQEAIVCFRRALAFEPFHPTNQLILAWALWGGGQLDEVDRLLESALRLWPQDRAIWQSRFDFLVLTGRTAPALALLNDDGAQPVISPDNEPVPQAALQDFARAMQSGAAADVERAAAQVVAARPSLGTYTVVPYLCALGRVDEAFGLLETYFLGSATVPPPAPLSRRKSAILFLARCAPLQGDPRYAQLTRSIGLDDYWRETGTRPDAGLVGSPQI